MSTNKICFNNPTNKSYNNHSPFRVTGHY